MVVSRWWIKFIISSIWTIIHNLHQNFWLKNLAKLASFTKIYLKFMWLHICNNNDLKIWVVPRQKVTNDVFKVLINLLDSCSFLIGSDFVRENNYNLWQWSRLLFFQVFLFLLALLWNRDSFFLFLCLSSGFTILHRSMDRPAKKTRTSKKTKMTGGMDNVSNFRDPVL